MSFIVKPLDSHESIGAKLKAMRRRLAISMDTAAESTRIQKKYLVALEADDYHNLPAPIYTRNFLRTYVKMLGGDTAYFLKRFDEERATCDVLVDPMRLPRQKVGWLKFLVAHRIFKSVTVAIVCLGIMMYLGWQIQSLLAAPEITVFEPIDGLATNQARIQVTGQAEEQVELFINSTQVLPDKSGFFSTTVDLERGLNVITIEATKRYSREAVYHRTVVFEDNLSTPSEGEENMIE